MGFEYSGDPSKSPKDLTRYLIGDTDKCQPLLQDEEINYVLGQYNNIAMQAAIRCCETICAKFSRLANQAVGPVRIDYSNMSKQYRDLGDDLRRRLAQEGMTPICGGISKADKQTVDQDADRVKPDFTKHEMENRDVAPWVIGQGGRNSGAPD